MTLVILGLFVVMMTAAVGLIASQFRQTAEQKLRLQNLQIAEAGVNYAFWLFKSGVRQPDDTNSILGHRMVDPETGDDVGEFDLEFDPSPSGKLWIIEVTATGRSLTTPAREQSIVVEIRRSAGGEYFLRVWDWQV